MIRAFEAAVHLKRFTVLGRQLQPLGLGHCWCLLAADNAWLADRKPLIEDLVYAVTVCSGTFEEALATLSNERKATEQAAAMGKAFKAGSLESEMATFGRYVRAHIRAPERAQSGTPHKAKHPWPILMAVRIMPLVGESRAWNMPLPMAITLWSAQLEAQGDDSLVSEEERNFIDSLPEEGA